eukprot:TRINITY_DN1036_c0_g1_i1.p1 TRINITY_DN1036_c0_g1~~TRINITY_DN1036_c0_g1_i1.p1  ORF type:complete len:178 (-),score=104.91 TRINITY_DN1036_c0_g1_i1:288-821(-)
MDLSEEEKEARLRAEEERLQNRMRNPGPASKVSSKPASKPFTFQSTGVNYGAPVNTSAGPNFKVQTNTNSLLNKYANDPAPQMAPTSTSSHSSSSSHSHDSKLTVILVTEENPNTILEKEEVLLSKGRIPLRNLLTKWRLSSVEWVEGETPLGMMADGYSDCAFNGLPSIRLWGTHL